MYAVLLSTNRVNAVRELDPNIALNHDFLKYTIS